MTAVWGLLRRVPKWSVGKTTKSVSFEDGTFVDSGDHDFQLIKPRGEYLGDGAHGKVITEYDDTGELVACKTIRFRTGTKRRTEAERECKVLAALSHENIVRYIDMHVTERPRDSEIRLYMEYCEHGSLKDLIEDRKVGENFVSENYIWSIVQQISAALKYCHFGLQKDQSLQPERGEFNWTTILHRDIKPRNILLASMSETAPDAIKVADFGLSIALRENAEPASYVGTRVYLAPEITSERKAICWTRECDIYSFGLTMYELCSLGRPFNYRIDHSQDVVPLPAHYTENLRYWISRCMSLGPLDRPSSAEIYDAAKNHVEMCNRGLFWTVKQSLQAWLEGRECFRTRHSICFGDYGTWIQSLAFGKSQLRPVLSLFVDFEMINYFSKGLQG
ncbi:kinase-like domain-containing protein [Rhexocercosporidium sp. MPI-PUGE-AT-0058]|nr:kinase-like domain-containing protein [Rhexocercosporidium sp. MPI-PUGE-AT-0058]